MSVIVATDSCIVPRDDDLTEGISCMAQWTVLLLAFRFIRHCEGRLDVVSPTAQVGNEVNLQRLAVKFCGMVAHFNRVRIPDRSIDDCFSVG